MILSDLDVRGLVTPIHLLSNPKMAASLRESISELGRVYGPDAQAAE